MTVAEMQEQIAAETKLREELHQYEGDWVAVREHHVVASAANLRDLINRVGPEPVDAMMQVPRDGETACFF